MKKGKGIALLPIGVFLVLYLGLGILFEYVMEIPMGFYNVPIVVAFLAAILVACLQNRALDFDKKLEIMAQGVGDKNIITMLLTKCSLYTMLHQYVIEMQCFFIIHTTISIFIYLIVWNQIDICIHSTN